MKIIFKRKEVPFLFSLKKISAFRSFLLICTGLLLAIPSALADSSLAAATNTDGLKKENYELVVIGDSLAAGYERGFTEASVPYGFAEHVYEQALFQGFRTEYSNFGILGLRSEGLYNWLLAAANGTTIAADEVQANLADPRAEQIIKETSKLTASISKADLILISIGGNDFTKLIADLDNIEGSSFKDEIKDSVVTSINTILQQYSANVDNILKQIWELNPSAQIAIADQYLPIPSPGSIHEYDPNKAEVLREGVKQLRLELESIASQWNKQGHKMVIADADKAIKGKEFLLTSIMAKDIHPNASGYKALGEAYSKAIWGDYLTLAPRAADVPISIIVNGKELSTQYAPVIIKGRTFLSLRDITDAIGADLEWDAATKTAAITLENRTVDITIGASTIRIDGETMPLNAVPAFMHKINNTGKTYVPLAALSEGLGLQVVYRDTLKAAFINE